MGYPVFDPILNVFPAVRRRVIVLLRRVTQCRRVVANSDGPVVFFHVIFSSLGTKRKDETGRNLVPCIKKRSIVFITGLLLHTRTTRSDVQQRL